MELVHGRPYHPQTQGKEERFHGTLKRELLSKTTAWRDLEHCDRAFAQFQELYNHVRPHRSLNLDCPAQRYRASARSMPDAVPACESFYEGVDQVRRAKSKGEITFRNRTYALGLAFAGERVGITQYDEDRWEVFYCWKSLGLIDMRIPAKPKNNYMRLAPCPVRLDGPDKEQQPEEKA